MDKNKLAKLSRDIYTGVTKNFEVSGDEAMRKLIFETIGVDENSSPRDRWLGFKENKYKVFQIIDVSIDAVVPMVVTDQFDSLANVQNVALGNVQKITIKNRDLFKVGLVAAGTQNFRRQTLTGSSYTVETDWYAVKSYTELEQFLTGTIDWAGFIDRIAESIATFTGQKIYYAFANSYDSVRANMKYSGTFDIDKLLDMARHVRATSRAQNVKVYGTITALSGIASKLELSEKMKDKLNETGYLTTVRGLDLYAFPDAYKAGTSEFIVDEKALIVIPGDEKIVDVVFEGESITEEDTSSDNNSLQMNYSTRKKMGIQVRKTAVYGYYKIA